MGQQHELRRAACLIDNALDAAPDLVCSPKWSSCSTSMDFELTELFVCRPGIVEGVSTFHFTACLVHSLVLSGDRGGLGCVRCVLQIISNSNGGYQKQQGQEPTHGYVQPLQNREHFGNGLSQVNQRCLSLKGQIFELLRLLSSSL